MRPSSRRAATGAVIAAVSISGLFVSSPAHAETPAITTLVEDGSYPAAAHILQTQNVKLIAGDGHIVLADCSNPPPGDIGLLKVYTTDETIGADGIGRVCFKINGSVGRLDLQVPGVYEIRGDGQRTGTGHQVKATLVTDTGVDLTVDLDPDGSTQVGLGADPDSPPTTLLQLRVGQGMAPVTGPNPAVGKLDIDGRTCTGTLIAPQWILSAASCFADNPDQPNVAAGAPAKASQVVFPGQTPAGITYLVPHADRDLVLAKLATMVVAIAPVRIATTPPAVGAALQAIGYGRTATEWVNDKQETAPVSLTGVTDATLTATTTGQVCKGYAGGPAFNGQGEIVGIHSRAGQSGCLDAAGTATTVTDVRVDNIPDWISANTPLVPSFTPLVPSFVINKVSEKCLVIGHNDSDVASQWGCWDQPEMKWRIQPWGTGTYHIVNDVSGKCLVIGHNDSDVASQRSCWDQPEMKWRIEPSGTGTYHIVNDVSGKCLVIGHNDSDVAGQWSCWDQPEMNWRFQTAPQTPGPVPPVAFVINKVSEKCLVIGHNDSDVASQWGCWDQPEMKWRIQPWGTGTYHIVNDVSGKCLVIGHNDSDQLSQWGCWDQPEMNWRFDRLS
ncbi:RICIN domain-containing protein [Catellatospora sichuanensis]|uniref:RICIN domain-containing protein n=1 Tax=Catellatospora sichuanensis TaxID=1969805 RepID=UPI001182F3C7|nr:RICIN domain-containing protein [Catellatospora sichuanensis]